MVSRKLILALTLLCFPLFLFIKCSKLKTEQPTAPQTEAQAHPAGWLDTLSDNFHGSYLRNHDWNLVACQKCHGEDYAGGSAEKSCLNSGCHPNTPESCTTCHGGVDNNTGAPPKDIGRHTERTFKGVGAHSQHVSSSQFNRAFDCDQCHKKPQKFNDKGHIDSELPAEIVWGELSKTDGLSPTWDGTTCSNVYCHGASLTDGTNSNPNWTQTTSLSCNSCHGLPPETGAHEKHVADLHLDCNICHDGYAKNSSVNEQLHINGKKDVQLAAAVGGTYADGKCSQVICHGNSGSPQWTAEGDFSCISCHGGLDNQTGAPPYDLSGNTATTNIGVGAHSAHVMEGDLRVGMDCSECHVKPHEIDDPDHVGPDLLPAEITWGDLAKNEDATPNWDRTTASCTNVYCHGEFGFGNQNNNPIWTKVDSSQAACGTCHGLPPDDPHPAVSQCYLCHPNVVDSDNNIIGKDKHINGQTDF
ncbi:MAG: CxxxxCH/CxxCH domain-containing protein [Calditrichaeota bacterium]|nr:CxxxxCH/CxxCH domain-containing protein [Calditrichota bacterium]